MKYVLIQTTYSPEREMVLKLYLAEDLGAWNHTLKLSNAHVWDTFNEITYFMKKERINDHVVVRIKEKDLFEARLKNK